MPQAVDEVLRFEPIAPFTARIVLEELEHLGVTFPRDTVVMVCAFTRNRDPEPPSPSRTPTSSASPFRAAPTSR